MGVDYMSSAWDLANLYLASFDAELLSDAAPRIVGLSESTTCYVSVEYFRQRNRFDDFVVHEAAHVFHNCKRERVGLPFTRYREWLLPIEYRRRETFAYACERYSRLLQMGARPDQRQAIVEEVGAGPVPGDERIDPEEYLDILREAAQARNGWKRILARCACPPPRR